jgi:hypothetical protein
MLHMVGAENEDFRCPMDTKTSKKDAAKAPTRQNTARERERSGGGNLSTREFKKTKTDRKQGSGLFGEKGGKMQRHRGRTARTLTGAVQLLPVW